MPAMDQKVLAEIKRLEAAGKLENPRYRSYCSRISMSIIFSACRRTNGPTRNRNFRQKQEPIYVPMQGPSELGASGKFDWDRTADLEDQCADAGPSGRAMTRWTRPRWRKSLKR